MDTIYLTKTKNKRQTDRESLFKKDKATYEMRSSEEFIKQDKKYRLIDLFSVKVQFGWSVVSVVTANQMEQ